MEISSNRTGWAELAKEEAQPTKEEAQPNKVQQLLGKQDSYQIALGPSYLD